MGISADVQKLEPGEWIELLTVDLTEIGGGVMRYHPYTQLGPIWWQGKEFNPVPYEASGFALTADQPPQPKLVVGNVNRAVTLLCQMFEDMVGAKVIRHRTLGKYLDAVNFTGGNAQANPNEHLPDDVWYIERKLEESPEGVQFELSTGANLAGMKVPFRQINADHCTWGYRSAECSYAGPPVATIDDQPTTNPALDRCSKRPSGCKKRFGENSPLPIGCFPAAGLSR